MKNVLQFPYLTLNAPAQIPAVVVSDLGSSSKVAVVEGREAMATIRYKRGMDLKDKATVQKILWQDSRRNQVIIIIFNPPMLWYLELNTNLSFMIL